jgi:uncharacterized RDD family membrane protein YckC/TM2 domain-containing membrane protein YozV
VNVLPNSVAGTAVLTPDGVTPRRSAGTTSRVHKPLASDVPRQLGPYRLIGEIGRGGMGSVYAAEDAELKRAVAVKILNREYWGNADFTARFQREARAAGSLSHRNIVQIYATGVENQVPYFAMEYVEGENLEEILLSRGPLPPTQAIDFMIQTAEGLRAAAQRGIIHRDIKPTNLLVVADGTIKIADFGLAKSMDFDSRLTVTGAVVGTPYYMSPEQGQGGLIDLRTDIYSMGATFYHLLAGDPPFQADTPVAIILKHINEAPPSLAERRNDLPPMLLAVIARMLAKSPADRHADYDELISDLAGARAGRASMATTIHLPAPAAPTKPARPGAPTILADDKPVRRIVLKRTGVMRWGIATALDVGLLLVAARIASWWSRDVGNRGLDERGVQVISLLLTVAYFVFADAREGRTLGKMFFRVRVADAQGGAIGVPRSLARFLLFLPLLIAVQVPFVIAPLKGLLQEFRFGQGGEYLIAISIFGVLIDYGYALLSRERRPVHDLAVNAYLFRELQVKVPKPAKVKTSKPAGPRLKSPVAAGFLSALCPGLGQIYNGQKRLGVVLMIVIFGTIWFGGIGLLIWAGAALHAVMTAARLRQQALAQALSTMSFQQATPTGAFVRTASGARQLS